MRHINEIIVHCSATKPGWYERQGVAAKCDEIRRWHVEDHGWSDIGYHYVIDRDGALATGRPVERVGAHVRGRNGKSIGICLIGAFGAAATDAFEDHFTEAQATALLSLIADLQASHQITLVTGHYQYAKKGCPGFEVPQFLERRRALEAAH